MAVLSHSELIEIDMRFMLLQIFFYKKKLKELVKAKCAHLRAI